jgi:hypothetical protein
MTSRLTSIAAASLLVFGAAAHAQQTPDASKSNPSAATSTGTSTTQAEMNRGVPGVNVDAGRRAPNGVISADVDRNTDARNLTDRDDTSGTRATRNARAARADRN